MQAATNVYLHALPPTFNTLDTRQRARLIRSTRKLGAVLGTTPQLVESDSPLSPAKTPTFSPGRDRKRRQGSVFEFPPPTAPFTYNYDSASSSSLALPRTSIDSHDSDASTHSLPTLPMPRSFARHVREKSRSKGKQTALPTPLVLRLNAVPLPPSDPRVQPATPDTAATLKTSATLTPSSLPLTPTTPGTPATPTVTETRRKRLAKLKRTLGENVPPELIMPFRSVRAQRPSPVDPPLAPQTMSPPARTALHPHSHHQERRPPMSMKARGTVPLVPGVRPREQRRRSVSVDFKHGGVSSASVFAPAPALAPKPKQRKEHSRSPSAFHMTSPRGERARTPELDLDLAVDQESEQEQERRRSSRVWVTGTGAWTGEWNRRDIREVQHQLRNLKIR
ncbi:hypothetical protein K466DRAFT_592163 [Polyporus arcularius HHB13444]|uniref:Uncharacterized protein n=1 Tax=Polyporus arcularius HHB13444 TaxID=1314778 RepID=A0A5C3NS73_9APHY|nr:hypothetical protein K466DRAFT_592163 [Polyporus arcularius HHB13444]